MATFLNTQSFASAPYMLAGIFSPTYTISDPHANTFIGTNFNTSSSTITNNVGIGNSVYGSMIITGTYNVAVGDFSLANLDEGSYNTAIGYTAGSCVGDGSSYNTLLGYQAGFGTSLVLDFSYSTAIGYQAVVQGDNQIVLGTAAETTYIPGSLNLTLGGGTSGYVLTTDGSGNATWQAGGGGGGGPTLAGTQTWTGVNTYNAASVFADTTAFNFATGAAGGYLLNSDGSGNATWITPATPIQAYLDSLTSFNVGLNPPVSPGANTITIGENVAYGGSVGYYSTILGSSTVGTATAQQGSVIIGYTAGRGGTGQDSVSIGTSANATGLNAIAIGHSAGDPTNSPDNTLAIGAGGTGTQNTNGNQSISIGFTTGQAAGSGTVCIGAYAGNVQQIDNCIILNATNTPLDSSVSGFIVAPVRTDVGTSPLAVAYDTSTNEFLVPTGPLVVNGLNLATGATSGYVLTSDGSGNGSWQANGSGTVSSVALTSSNLTVTGSPITTSGTLTVALPATAVTAGSYTLANITVDAFGRITAASSTTGIPTLAGTQTFTGVDTFSQQAVFSNSVKIPLSATSGYVLTSDASGNATWQVNAALGGPTLAATQSWTGVNTYTQTSVFSAANAFKVSTGAVAGYVLTSDASGNATWQASGEPAVVTVSTTDATPTTLVSVPVASNTAVTLSGTVAARNTSGTINDATGGRYTVTAINTAGVLSIVATSEVLVMATSTGSFNAVVSGTNLIIQVTGIAATNYNWKSAYAVSSL